MEATKLGSKGRPLIGQGNANHWMSYERDVLQSRALRPRKLFSGSRVFFHMSEDRSKRRLEN